MARRFTIGELAGRAGVNTSALRFYEDRGLIESERTEANHRLYAPHTLRRVSVIRAAQAVGLTLNEIEGALAALPDRRTPTTTDWERMSSGWRNLLQTRIDRLTDLRDRLGSCIGCGCLSLETCALLNPGDRAEASGSGARYLAGDDPVA
jgi:MerR family transcriptional regulator, redox-sensitive transcriptional activator SoxR